MTGVDGIRIGVDITNETDMTGMMENRRALSKVFSERELSFRLNDGEDVGASLARGFAAKEAVVKAWGKAVGNMAAIEVLRDDSGAPFVVWDELTRHNLRATVSLSSSHPFAVAVAVLVPGGDTG